MVEGTPRALPRPLQDLPTEWLGSSRNRGGAARRPERPGRELIRGAQGVPEGIDPARADEIVDKFHEEDGLLVVRAGGKGAGQSAIIGGWPAQRRVEEIKIVSQEVGI